MSAEDKDRSSALEMCRADFFLGGTTKCQGIGFTRIFYNIVEVCRGSLKNSVPTFVKPVAT